MKYYHVTLLSNLKSILKNGLVPQIGERSLEAKENKKAVYLFSSLVDAENALMNWLGDWYTDTYGEDIPLALLEIDLDLTFPLKNGDVEYEVISEITIPSKHISFMREE